MVQCVKLKKEAPGLDYPPFGGPLGVRIWNEVSDEAWKMFTEHFKMVMNENRLQGGTDQATKMFLEQAEQYFYGTGVAAPPPDFKPKDDHGHGHSH